MLLPSFLATTVLALTANAFLVPLEVADQAKEAAAEQLSTAVLPTSQTINLDCSDCPFAINGENGVHEWATSPPKTNLVMKFGTTDDKKQVTLNGAPFYPATLSTMMHPLSAKQVIQPDDKTVSVNAFDGELGLSYSIDQAAVKTFDDNVSLIPMTLTVLGLDGEMVNVDSINIPVIKTANGDLSLAEVKTVPTPPTPGSAACLTVMCRIRSIIIAKMYAARLAALKAVSKLSDAKTGCMRKLGFKVPAPFKTPTPAAQGPKVHGGPPKFAGKFPGKENHHNKHHGEKGHGRKHGVKGMFCAIKRVFKHVLLPVLIGIAAGMAASAIGMLIGQIVVLLWMRYRRESTPAYESVQQVEEGRASEDSLPPYEDVEEMKEADVVVDEKKELLG